MATKLTHKVRNPKDLDQWLELWTADITKIDNPDDPDHPIINYTINPSEKWNIEVPITNITVENGENIVTSNIQKDDAGDNDEGLAYIDWNKITKTIKADRGLSIKDDNTIGHSNTEINSGSTSYSSSGPSITIPTIEYNNYGHITKVGTQKHTVNNLNINSLDPENFTPGIGSSNGKNFDNTVIDIIKNNTSQLTFNSADKDGIVKAVKDNNEDESHTNTVWASNNVSNPGWRKITNDMIDSSTQISGSKIEINTAEKPGVIPKSGSLGPQFWGVPSNEYEKAANFTLGTAYYILDENGGYKKANPQPNADNFNPDTYYVQKESSPQWSSLTLSTNPLSITYNKSTSTLTIGIDTQLWKTPKDEIEGSTDGNTPLNWSKYIVNTVNYMLS